MTLKIQIIIGGVLLMGLIALVNMIKRRKMDLKYALLWIILIIGLMILDLFPGLMDALAAVVGISSAVNMIFFMGFCFSLGIIFALTVAVSRMSDRLRKLAQALALTEKRLLDLLEKGEDTNEKEI